ncbi:MAG: AAA family ATPase [Planctomycetota bacterium]|nr:AAA family ATPase [Planctomycetota bacterium]
MIPRIFRVEVRNYKSIAQVSAALEPLTVLVGPNGSGKSNFIDSLAFLQECLSASIEVAFRNRGGIGAVRRRSGGHPTHIGIRICLHLAEDLSADYAFEIAAKRTGGFSVARERCMVKPFMKGESAFEVRNGVFVKEIPGIRPKVSSDRLALYAASAIEEFRPVYDFLTAMRFYSVVPTRLRELQDADPGLFLKRDGSNAAAVLKHLTEDKAQGHRYDRLCSLLSKVVEGLRKVEYRAVGQKETLQFRQEVGAKHPWTFDPLNMSDGTLRVLGLLLAVYQPGQHSVVAIEEPEATVHPAVTEILVQVLMDASNEHQILLTTHSPDILDQKGLEDTQIRVVSLAKSRTQVSPLSDSSRKAIRERLYTPGELLRAGELGPDLRAAASSAEPQDLFGPLLACPGESQ